MKIGKVVQLVLRPLLEGGKVSEDEIIQLQDKKYSNDVLNLNYPLLVKTDADYDKLRYYNDPLHINGIEYVMCSQWIERPENNDRPYLMNWIRAHQ